MRKEDITFQELVVIEQLYDMSGWGDMSDECPVCGHINTDVWIEDTAICDVCDNDDEFDKMMERLAHGPLVKVLKEDVNLYYCSLTEKGRKRYTQIMDILSEPQQGDD